MDVGDRNSGEVEQLSKLVILWLVCVANMAHAQDSLGKTFQLRKPDSAERAAHLSPADSAARVERAKVLFEKGRAFLAKGQRDSARLALEGAVTLDHHN